MVPVTRSGRLPEAEVLELEPPLLAEEDPLLEVVEVVELLPPQAARAPVAIKRKKTTHAKVLMFVRATICLYPPYFIVRLRLAKKISPYCRATRWALMPSNGQPQKIATYV